MDKKYLSALQLASEELEKFIDYLKTIDIELEEHEATLLAAVLLQQLPTVLQSNQELLKQLLAQGDRIKQKTRNK